MSFVDDRRYYVKSSSLRVDDQRLTSYQVRGGLQGLMSSRVFPVGRAVFHVVYSCLFSIHLLPVGKEPTDLDRHKSELCLVDTRPCFRSLYPIESCISTIGTG